MSIAAEVFTRLTPPKIKRYTIKRDIRLSESGERLPSHIVLSDFFVVTLSLVTLFVVTLSLVTLSLVTSTVVTWPPNRFYPIRSRSIARSYNVSPQTISRFTA
jgi:hypothetical protein